MKNMNELRTELSDVFTKLRSGKLDVKIAGELNNTAGKIINSVKVELEFYALTKQTPVIDFLTQPENLKIGIEERKKIGT